MNTDANDHVDDVDDTSLADLLFDGPPVDEPVRATIPGFPSADQDTGPGADSPQTVELPEVVERQPLTVTVVTAATTPEPAGTSDEDTGTDEPARTEWPETVTAEPVDTDDTPTGTPQTAGAGDGDDDRRDGPADPGVGDASPSSLSPLASTLLNPYADETSAPHTEPATSPDEHTPDPGSDVDQHPGDSERDHTDEPVGDHEPGTDGQDLDDDPDSTYEAAGILQPDAARPDPEPVSTNSADTTNPNPDTPGTEPAPTSDAPDDPGPGIQEPDTTSFAGREPAPVPNLIEPITPDPGPEPDPQHRERTHPNREITLKAALTTPISLRTEGNRPSLKEVLTTPISLRKKPADTPDTPVIESPTGVSVAALDGIARYIDTKERWTPKHPDRVRDAATVAQVPEGSTMTETLTRIANQLLADHGHTHPTPETVHAVALTLSAHLDGHVDVTDHQAVTRTVAQAARRQPNPKTWITRAARGFNSRKVTAALAALDADPGSTPAAQQALIATAEAVATTIRTLTS